jgi:hypothetical protein
MDYGFSGVNKTFNSKQSNNNTLLNLANLNDLIIVARVKSIIMDENHPRFKELGEWNALGLIEYEVVSSPTPNFNVYPIASPLLSNSKNLPLINEIVYILTLSSTNIGLSNTSVKQYYINNISLWNHPHHNAYPTQPNLPSPTQKKDYEQTQAGSVRRVTDQSTEIFLGKTFKERSNIHPLLPFEGDIIYEGRWGNSIRLGSTVKDTSNNWSNAGENGDPIFIIRNGQGIQTDEGWIPTLENINNDDSSIYLTSTQQIPLQASSTSYTSYKTPPTSINKFSGKQIILNSGRLVFNSNLDHILFSSAKSINLNSQESVNIDTKKFITQADQIFLGKEELANQPLMLGNNTVDLLKNIITAIKDLTNSLQNLQTAPVAPYSTVTFPTLPIEMNKIKLTIESLEKEITAGTLTSKRNFTL